MLNELSNWAVKSIVQNGIALVLILVCMETSKSIAYSKMLQLWGKNSMVIMALHIYFLEGIAYFLGSSLNIQIDQVQNIYAVITVVLTLKITEFFIKLLNEWYHRANHMKKENADV